VQGLFDLRGNTRGRLLKTRCLPDLFSDFTQ
jgi:hypothetical protein